MTSVGMPASSASTGCRTTGRPRTVFLDWSLIESTLGRSSSDDPPEADSRRPRLVTTVEHEISSLRKNVQDSACAVLTWLAAVTEHEGGESLDRVLDRCLRPGPDVQRVNFNAMAEEIRKTLNIDITAKRVRTAVRHLRRAHQAKFTRSQVASGNDLEALHSQIVNASETLVSSNPTVICTKDESRKIAVEVLAVVRSAASRLIDNDFGEGISGEVDQLALANRFLEYVQNTTHRTDAPFIQTELRQLLVGLSDYDATIEGDMRLVICGSRLIKALTGADSLMGVLARLNVLVAGRNLLETKLYVDQLLQLADTASSLHDDPDTLCLLNWVRRLPEDRRFPSPLRVASYCLNNATTRIFERLFTGQLETSCGWLEQAVQCFEQMQRRDGGFCLIKTTQVIHLVLQARLSGQDTLIREHFTRLGPTRTVEVLSDLIRFDNCPELVAAARCHAIDALPQVRHQLIAI